MTLQSLSLSITLYHWIKGATLQPALR